MNKKINRLYLFIIIIALSATLASCNKSIEEEKLSDVFYEYKTEYVGDNSKVLGIINNIQFSDEYDHIQILSDDEPYGLNIYFKDDKKSLDIDQYNLEAAIIFSLIENLDDINFLNKDENIMLHLSREEVDEDLEINTSDIYNSKKLFDELINEYISQRNIYIKVNSNNYKEQEKKVKELIKTYIPDDTFEIDSMEVLKNQSNENILIYLSNVKDGEIDIKLEIRFNDSKEIEHYRFKNYSYDFESKKTRKLKDEEAITLAQSFLKDINANTDELNKTPDAYKSLYEKNKHEVYSNDEYIVVVDMELGYVEYFGRI